MSGELGREPLSIIVYKRVISLWRELGFTEVYHKPSPILFFTNTRILPFKELRIRHGYNVSRMR